MVLAIKVFACDTKKFQSVVIAQLDKAPPGFSEEKRQCGTALSNPISAHTVQRGG